MISLLILFWNLLISSVMLALLGCHFLHANNLFLNFIIFLILSVIQGLLFNFISPGESFFMGACMSVHAFIQSPMDVIKLIVYIVILIVPILNRNTISKTFRGELRVISDIYIFVTCSPFFLFSQILGQIGRISSI